MTLAIALTVTTCVGLYVVLSPHKTRQTEYMRGVTDAQAMVERQGLQLTCDYYHRKVLGISEGDYLIGWQDFLWSKQADLAHIDYKAKQTVGAIVKRGVA